MTSGDSEEDAGSLIEFDTIFELFEHQYVDAVAFGCTYEEFWCMDPLIYWWKQEAYEVQQRIKWESQDISAWMAGYYVVEAIATAFADKRKPHDYPHYPSLVETMDDALREKRKMAELIAMRDQFLAVSTYMPHDKEAEYELLGEPV